MTDSDIILGLLMENSRTGYEINEVFETIFSHFYRGSYGMIYPTLKKLQKQGLVEKEVLLNWIKDEVQRKKDLIAQLKRDFKNWESDMTFSQKLSYEIGIRQYQVEIDLLNEKILEFEQIINIL